MRAQRSERRSRVGVTGFRSLLLSVALLAILPSLAFTQGYSYEESKDPLILKAKAVIGAARAGGAGVDGAVEALRPDLVEIETGLGVELGPQVDAAQRSRDSRRLARAVAEVVYHQLRNHLEHLRKTDLSPPPMARRRLQTAQHYYTEILSFTVRREDSVHGTQHHANVLVAFRTMQDALGSEGLFGFGSRDPEPQSFALGAEAVLRSLRASFPDFKTPRPNEFGADPASPPPPPPNDGER